MANMQPVIVGGDIGVYALARAFHEAYATTSVILAEDVPGPIANSNILDVRVIEVGQDAEKLVAALEATAAELAQPGLDLVCLTNSDWYARLLVENRERIEAAGYFLPFPDVEVFRRVSDKQEFAKIAQAAGMRTPRTEVLDFTGADEEGWKAPQTELPFPLIGKPAVSSYWQTVHFEGKEKISYLATPRDYDQLMIRLYDGGFRGEYLVQELIPGGDTTQRSVTAYVDSSGKVTLLSGADVLLEDHTPAGTGIPTAMVSSRDDALLEPARRFLESVGYHGFANFDAKIDPRDGSAVFFEVNPRIGRNNYYVCAGGTNPAKAIAADLDGVRDGEISYVNREVLYNTVPNSLLLNYLSGEDLERAKHLIRAKETVNPVVYPKVETSLKRLAYTKLSLLKHRQKYREHYPRPTDSGF